MKKTMLTVTALLSFTFFGWSQESLADYHWQDLAKHGLAPAGEPVMLDGREALKLQNLTAATMQFGLLTIQNPKITEQVYELTGEIQYDSASGDGFLELWSYFDPLKPGLPERHYFSRTADEHGPTGKIRGISNWREFVLPFDWTGASNPPTRLQLNLILTGYGTVYLGPVKLVQIPKARLAGAPPNLHGWWSEKASACVGGGAGALIGCLGGLIGLLVGLGRARGFVTIMLVALTGLGMVLGAVGLFAVAQHQPYHVWYPQLLLAFLLLVICPAILLVSRKAYETRELRRMAALDASGA
jgi:hypothetical protein